MQYKRKMNLELGNVNSIPGTTASSRWTGLTTPLLDARQSASRCPRRRRYRGRPLAASRPSAMRFKRHVMVYGLTLALCLHLVGVPGFVPKGFAASEGQPKDARLVAQTARINASGVSLRPEPSTRSAPIGTLNRGQLIDILGWEGAWYYVRAGRLGGFDVVGYVPDADVTLPGSTSPAPPRKTSPAPSTSARDTVEPSSGSAYIVQAGVVEDPANAARLVERLSARGFGTVRQEKVTLEAGPYTRVILGPFRVRAQADHAVSELKVLGADDAIVRREHTGRPDPQHAPLAGVPPVENHDNDTQPPEVQAKAKLGPVDTSKDVFTLEAATQAPAAARHTGRRPVKSLLEMRRDQTVVQQWDLSCGAAALATLLTYQHGDPVPEREIAEGLIRREEYIARPALIRLRQGFSLLDLKRYVEQRGYTGTGYGGLTLENLIERAPIMVPVNLYGYNHFVVFRGMMGNRVLLADPAWGKRTMLRERFENAWLVYPEVGRVGFVVQRRDGATPPNRLAPQPSDFVSLG